MVRRNAALLFALAPLAGAAPPIVTVDVAPREGSLGDQVSVSAHITTETGQQLGAVTLADPGDAVAVVGNPSLTAPQPGDGGTRTQNWSATLALFATGEVTLPRISVFWSSADTPSAEVTADLGAVTVRPVIPAGSQPMGPKDPRGPFEIPVPPARWPYYVGAGVVALAALLYWLWSRRQPREDKPVKPARPPFEQALADLDALSRSGLITEQRHHQFFYALTAIVRVYFENECGIGAPEMTTEELLLALRENHFPAMLCEQVQRWTAACDLVKYASQRPRSEHCETAITLGRAIVTSAHHHHLAVQAAATDAAPPPLAEPGVEKAA